MKPVRIAFHVELDRLLGDLARMTRLTGQMMTNASIALHQTDRALATLVDAEHEQLNMALTDVHPMGSGAASTYWRCRPRSPGTCAW